MKLFIQFQTSTVQPLKLGNEWVNFPKVPGPYFCAMNNIMHDMIWLTVNAVTQLLLWHLVWFTFLHWTWILSEIFQYLFQALSIEKNRISDISFSAFTTQTNLTNLTLGINFITVLPYLRSTEYNLKHLDMNTNKINAIADGYFANFSSLSTLILSYNMISAITQETLSGLSALETLELSGNRITEVSCDALHDCVRLVHLQIGENELTALPCVAFSSTTLRELGLGHNDILRVVDIGRSQHLSQVTSLDMTGNGLLSLRNIITEMPSLEIFAVGENPDLEFQDNDFLNSPRLTSITFAGKGPSLPNRLVKMPYLGPAKSVMTTLNLGYSSLECVDIHHISNMIRLHYLNVTHNMLVRFPAEGCSSNPITSNLNDIRFPSLNTVILDYNQLVEFPLLPELPLGSTISINGNRLSSFPPERMALLDKVQSISITHNDATIFPDFSQLRQSQLQSFFAHDCRISSIPLAHIEKLSKLQTLKLQRNRISELPYMGFASHSLVTLDVGYNMLETLDPMLLAEGQTWFLTSLMAENNRIASIPINLWGQMVRLEQLCLQHNRLVEMPNLSAVGVTLKDVDLSQNLITIVPHECLDGLGGLEKLKFSNNRIVDFPFWKLPLVGSLTSLDLGYNQISSLGYLNTPSINSMLVLNIINNPIICSGDICWLRNFDRFTITREDRLCRTQPELSNINFNGMSDSLLGCPCRSHLKSSTFIRNNLMSTESCWITYLSYDTRMWALINSFVPTETT